jgi:hypothetical protein
MPEEPNNYNISLGIEAEHQRDAKMRSTTGANDTGSTDKRAAFSHKLQSHLNLSTRTITGWGTKYCQCAVPAITLETATVLSLLTCSTLASAIMKSGVPSNRGQST